jgi:hypothetical protein
MTNADSLCPDCSAPFVTEDNYCRQCGMYLAALREMSVVTAEPATPAPYRRERAGLPAPVKKAATALAIGTALQIGAGIAGRYLANQAARGAISAATTKPTRRSTRETKPAPSTALVRDPMEGAAAVSETVMIRRVWIRRP